jgi:hypothetical protein
MPRFLILIIALITPPITAAPPTPIPGERAATYVARYNEWLETIPMEDRAWEELQRIDALVREAFGGFRGQTSNPEDTERWAATVQFIKDHPKVMEAIRTNAAKPELGMLICDTKSPQNAFEIIVPQLSMILRQSELLAASMIIASEKQGSAEKQDTAVILQHARDLYNLSTHIPIVSTGIEYAVLSANHKLLTTPILDGTTNLTIFNLHQLQELDDLIKSSSQARPLQSIEFDHFGAIDTIFWCYEDSQDGALTENGAKKVVTILSAYKIESDIDPESEHATYNHDDSDRINWIRSSFAPLDEQLDFVHTYFSMLKSEISVLPHQIQSSQCSEMLNNALNDVETLKKYRLSLLSLPSIDRLLTINTQSSTSLNATRLLIAAHRHKLTHGSFPQTLADFDPTFLTFTPTDLFTGNPLHYRLADNQPLIYSSGTDRDDDNARPLLDEDGIPIDPPPFYPLDPLKEILKNDPQSIDGDWVLTPS